MDWIVKCKEEFTIWDLMEYLAYHRFITLHLIESIRNNIINGVDSGQILKILNEAEDIINGFYGE